MALSLPPRPSLEWLRKTAKDHLRALRAAQADATLAQAQLDLARQYGFASWRALKAHIDRPTSRDDQVVRRFLERVGTGDLNAVRELIAADPGLVHATGPHPFWGGRPQATYAPDPEWDAYVARREREIAAKADGRRAPSTTFAPRSSTTSSRAATRSTASPHPPRRAAGAS
jgi:hypothetical protein